MTTTTTERTAVTHSLGRHVMRWTAFPGGGAVLGVAVAFLPGWIAALPWAPHQQEIAELAEAIGPTATIALAITGGLIGGLVTPMACQYIVVVTISAASVALDRRDNTAVFRSAKVSGAFVDAKHLVVLGAHGEELARERTDLKPDKLRAGFETHGYDWHERDPYGDMFTRWIDGSSGLSRNTHTLLRARQTAIRNGDTDELRDLRRELARHGVVVRDDGKHQYWRPAAALGPQQRS
nr:hypothetical protein [Kibdelosporangium sp. MJ126-NF4]CEL17476.1 unknown [Kibdelosporangium sp. MJ126-NF4]CTQ91297.1 unknown [Kibdelosporangium sp. MJ126-NF4]